MPATTSHWLPGPVGTMLRNSGLASTTRVPLSGCSLITTTGHVGLDLSSGELVNSTLDAEFNAIFNCLHAALKHSGVEDGLAGAHKITCYFTAVDQEAVMLRIWRQRWPQTYPAWTSVVVKGLVSEGMHAEVQAEAVLYD